jgi:hypothetical protein
MTMPIIMENTVTDMNEEHVDVWKDKYSKLLSMWNLEARDTSILLPIIQHFWTMCVERSAMHEMISAVQYAMDDTGIEPQDIIDRLNELGFDLDIENFRREYEVTVTIPVSVTVTVEAMNEDQAEEAATEYIDNHGVEAFSLDYDIYNVTIDNVYEVCL